MDSLLNYKQAAEFLAVPVGTLYAWVSQKRLPFIRFSQRCVRFRREALETWLEEHSQPASSNTRSGVAPVLAAPRHVRSRR